MRSLQLTHAPTAEDVALLDGCGALVLDGRHGAFALAMAREARARGVPVLLDAETRDRPCAAELLACADIVVTSASAPLLQSYLPAATEIFYDTANNMDALFVAAQHVLDENPAARCVVVTHGEHGAHVLSRTPDGRVEETHCAAEHVPALQLVDTTGAGDAFVAALACATARGCGLAGALRLAAHVSARKCTQLGAHAGTPHLAELPPDLQHLLLFP